MRRPGNLRVGVIRNWTTSPTVGSCPDEDGS
jgi:hypothetical protein